MNCQEALHLLYDIIDKEASDIDTKEVTKHLEQCRHCFDRYQLETDIQKFIDERVKSQIETPSLESLKSKLTAKLDEIDHGSCSSESKPTPFFKSGTRMIAAAASLVILIGAAYLISSFYRHQDQFGPFEQAHLDGNSATLLTDSRKSELLQSMESQLHLAVADEVSSFSLVKAGNLTVDEHQIPHLVYVCSGGRLVSVFVVSADDFEIPNAALDDPVACGELTMYLHNCAHCKMAYYRVGDAVVITATSDQTVDLQEFLPGQETI
jgi:anti-sigma factor (TIGR02949 family)